MTHCADRARAAVSLFAKPNQLLGARRRIFNEWLQAIQECNSKAHAVAAGESCERRDERGLGNGDEIMSRAGIILVLVLAACAAASAQPTASVRVDADPRHVLNSFDPDEALGSSIDVLSRRDIDNVFTPHIIQESLSAGWGPMTYRNNTELRMGAWHWNSKGSWSDAAHQSGYWTSSQKLGEPLRYILAYALPHRGFSTSGDRPVPGPELLFWKSNPYLTSRFTGESDEMHPQWVVEDLKAEQRVNAVRIAWENPYATKYRVEYWTGKDALDFDRGPEGKWTTFASGDVQAGTGGTVTLRLGGEPLSMRFVRVLMVASSNICDLHGAGDVRNCVGYAIQSIEAGQIDDAGSFTAAPVAAGPPSYCSSSIDPWHSAADVRDDGLYQHTGFDLFFTSGITSQLPAMVPVTMLYGTPEDAAAAISYLEKRGYPISYVEMGEEPDGKHAMPEDYGALYIQWARALHKVDPKLKLGGPIFEGVNEDIRVWPDADGQTSWMGRFVNYLRTHDALGDLSFVSFEHYPFEPCEITWKSLYSEPRLMKHILQVWRDDGVPKGVPLMVTESHVAAGLTGPMSTIFAGLWLADSIGSFFEAGGAAYYHSPVQPQGLQDSCEGWASWSNFVSNSNYDINGYTSLYFAAQLINREWAQHRSGVHRMFPVAVDLQSDPGNAPVTAYALNRPDGTWSLMLVNRDESTSHEIQVVFENGAKQAQFSGKVRMVNFGRQQYQWRNEGLNSHADPDGPAVARYMEMKSGLSFELPEASITVLSGRVSGLER
jgi:hypothetical protein